MNLKSFFQSSLWNTSFRPFFLFGSLYGVYVISVWLLILVGWMKIPFSTDAIQWHSYEMVFGFSRAIILGFLFTAAQNWTGTKIIYGKSLVIFFMLWLLGRFTFYDLGLFSFASYGLDIACDFYAIFLVAPKFWRAGQEHNRIILYNYLIFTLFHVLAGFSILTSIWGDQALHFIHLSVFTAIIYIVIIAGRIVPFFTGVVVSNYGNRRIEVVEHIIIQTSFLFYVMESLAHWFTELTPLAGFFSIFFGAVNFFRLLYWKPWVASPYPILWILHIGYFWLSLGFVLLGFTHFGMFPQSSAYHVMTIGAIGVFVYGMISRVGLGHTGRRIVASPILIIAYVMINLAVVTRAFLPLGNYHYYAYLISGIFWILSFGIFFIKYFPYLTQARPDGKIG